jgi:hypothetical protein
LPAIYDVTVNVQRGTEIIATEHREIGLRSLGVRGRGLVLAGKAWVLRGVSTCSTNEVLPRFWHNASAAFVADDPDADTLAEASQWGALTAVHTPAQDAAANLRQLSHFPGAAIAIFPEPLPSDLEPARLAPNLLVGQMIDFDDPSRIDPRVHLVVAGAHLLQHSKLAQSLDKPVVATRRLERPFGLAEARAACDVLRRDLAPIGQFAGYIV